MKGYTIRIKDKEVARAIFDMFIEGIKCDDRSLDPSQKEALHIITRLGEWAEGIKCRKV